MIEPHVKKAKEPPKISQMYGNVAALFDFFRQARIVPVYFFLSVVCTSLAVIFNLLGLKLLITLLQGLLKSDFASVGDPLGILHVLSRALPQVFGHPVSRFVFLLGVIFASVVIKNALDYAASLSVGYQIKQADRHLRAQVIRRYLSFGKLHFDRTNAVTATHLIMNAASGVTGQLKPLQKMLSQLMTLAMYLAMMLWISWPLTLIAILIFPVMNAVNHRLVQSIQGAARSHELSQIRLMDRIGNAVACIPLVKAYAAERSEERRLADVSDEEIRLAFDTQKKHQLIRPVQDLTTMAALLLMVTAMVTVFPAGSPERVSEYLVFFYIVRMAMPNFGAISNFRISLATAEAQIERLREMLERDDNKYRVPGGPKEFEGLREGIDFKNLSFAYRGQYEVLRGVNFKIAKGSVTAIVGATGAGKTTLVHLLVRFYDCPPGTIWVDGEDIRDFSIESLMERIAFVSQDQLLFNDTLRANLAYGLKTAPDDAAIFAALEKARLDGLVRKLPDGLDTMIGDRGVQLSGGERQRAALARAFLKDADILILDEATSALDSRTERNIQQAIEEAMKGKTAIVIAHRLSTIRNADHIVVIDDGRMIEQGTMASLLEAKGKFYEYWQAQEMGSSLQNVYDNIRI